MSLARKNSILSKTINVDHSANGDTLFIPHSGIVNISGILTATSGNFSSQTVFASGSAATPGISIIGDTDTGIAQLIRGGESANTLSLVVGGTERMRIEPGNVKILTPTDDTAEFSISNSIDRDAYVIIDGGSNAGRSAVLEGRANGAQEWYICSTRFHEDGPNNGMALNVAGSNPMTFRTNNTEKMRITSGGNVGIGTSSPNAKLEIQGSSGVYTRLGTTSSSFYVVHNGTTDTFLYTQEASPLRIGTSATERLRITSGGNLEIKSNAGNISTLFTYNENGGELVHYDDTQTAATLLDQCNNSTRLLELINGSDLILGLGGSNSTGSIRFMRAGYNEAMRIDSTGAVGIGTSNPSTPLHVVSFATSDANKATVMLEGTVATSQSFAGIRFKHNVYTTGWGADILAIDSPNFNAHLTFRTTSGGTNTSSPVERMRITSDGNVGIGTSTVSYRLHVVGNASAANNVVCYLNNTGGTRSRLAFQDTAVSYAPDMGSVGNSLTFDTVGVERVRIGNNGRTQFFAANEKFGIQLNNGSTGNGPFIGSDGADIFCISTAGGAERVRVDASGNVGIGGASGGNVLHVFGTTDSIAAFGGSTKHVRIGYDSTADRGIIECSDFGTIAKNLIIRGRDIIFENAIFGVGEGMRLTDANELRIGYPTTDNGAYKLQVNSQIYATNATIATSDARFKTNVESLNDATAVIEALRPVAFDFLPHAERNFATERQVGLIAQEAQAALAGTDYADSVVAQCGDHLGLAYEKLVPVLIKALQESNARIAALEQRINA